jgi:hypothetical protein
MSITRPDSGWNMERVTIHPGEILREEFMNRSVYPRINSPLSCTFL